MELTDWEEIKKTNRGILWKGFSMEHGSVVYVVYIGRRRKPPKPEDFDFKHRKDGSATLNDTAWAFVNRDEPNTALKGAENLFKIHCK